MYGQLGVWYMWWVAYSFYDIISLSLLLIIHIHKRNDPEIYVTKV